MNRGLAGALLSFVAATAFAQSVPVRNKPSTATDFQGVWTSGTLTPFERPPALGTKAVYTPEELVQVIAQGRARVVGTK